MAKSNNANDETESAQTFIDAIFSSKWDDGDKLMRELKNKSALLSYSYAFHSFMKAVLASEHDSLEKAYQDLKDCQVMCTEPENMIQFLKNSITFSLGILNNKNYQTQTKVNYKEKLIKDIIIADCKLYGAALQVINYDSITNIISAGLEIRKAWKTYAHIHNMVFTKLKSIESNFEKEYFDQTKMFSTNVELQNEATSTEDDNITTEIDLGDINEEELSVQDLKAILGAVCYGYGIIQLGLSFLPPYVMPLLKFLGFLGNRVAALTALGYTSRSEDIRSSFADIVLIAYSTIGIQFIGYNEVDMFLNKQEVEILIDKNLKRIENSWLFLYLKAKHFQINCKNNEKGFEYMELTKTNSIGIKELECLVNYELGFFHLAHLDYENAFKCFSIFVQHSKFSCSLNAYIKIILNGCLDKIENLKQDIKEILDDTKSRKNPIEIYARQRIEYLATVTKITKKLCQLLAIELVYSFLFFQITSKDNLLMIIKVLDMEDNDHGDLINMKHLIIGSCYLELSENQKAKQFIEKSIDQINDKNWLSYINPNSYCHLCFIHLQENDVESANECLKLAKQYTNYRFKDRLQAHMRSLERRIKYKIEQQQQ